MIWQYIVAFILFLLCLSILIMIHEAGHLAAAKLFKVYCFDYSIGFGPALLHKKRKNGETYFSIRAIPFGGFVSMYGEHEEGMELPDDVQDIPEERSLAKIKPWKRAIVLVAGVTLNAVLALVLFFVSACLPQQRLYVRYIEVAENSIAYNAGLTSNDILYYEMPHRYSAEDLKDLGSEERKQYEKAKGADYYIYLEDEAYIANLSGYFIIDKETIVTFNDDTTKAASTIIDGGANSKLSFKTRDYDSIIKYYFLDDQSKINYSAPVELAGVKSITVNLKTVTFEEENPDEPILTGNTYSLLLNNNEGTLDSYGITMCLHTEKNSFGKIMKNTFTKFGESSIVIFKTIGGLFIGQGWTEVGGIVAVYQQTATIFAQYNASIFIQLWAMISVNLAIFNLIPFPGLDGWQLLVLIIESASKRKVPPKVKTIVSIVGMAILFTLMVLIIVKDIVGIAIGGF